MDVRSVDTGKTADVAYVQPVRDKQRGNMQNGSEDHVVTGVNKDHSKSRHGGFHHEQDNEQGSEFEWLDSAVESDTPSGTAPNQEIHLLDVKV